MKAQATPPPTLRRNAWRTNTPSRASWSSCGNCPTFAGSTVHRFAWAVEWVDPKGSASYHEPDDALLVPHRVARWQSTPAESRHRQAHDSCSVGPPHMHRLRARITLSSVPSPCLGRSRRGQRQARPAVGEHKPKKRSQTLTAEVKSNPFAWTRWLRTHVSVWASTAFLRR